MARVLGNPGAKAGLQGNPFSPRKEPARVSLSRAVTGWEQLVGRTMAQCKLSDKVQSTHVGPLVDDIFCSWKSYGYWSRRASQIWHY